MTGGLFSHSHPSLPPVATGSSTCNKGGDPGREGFFSEGNEVVVEIGVFGNDHN